LIARRRIVVVGASLAGLRAAEKLRAEGFDGALTILGAEPHLPYDRPPLSKELLAGTREPEGVALRVAPGLDASGVSGIPRPRWTWAPRVGPADRRRDASSPSTAWSRHGQSGPGRCPGPRPASAPGVHELRTLDDALRLREALAAARASSWTAAGFIGVEVASTASQLGAAGGPS
jgi:NADPH-dependent 2,4-dienoyl-CoA reductase/sulfur reductase-like enzyme